MEFQVLDQKYQEKGSQKNGGQVPTLNRKLKINQRFPYKEDRSRKEEERCIFQGNTSLRKNHLIEF